MMTTASDEVIPAGLRASKPGTSEDEAPSLEAFQHAAALLKQGAEPTRVRILVALAEGQCHAVELRERLGLGETSIKHHLALLCYGSLVAQRHEGRRRHYRLTEAGRALAKVVEKMI